MSKLYIDNVRCFKIKEKDCAFFTQYHVSTLSKQNFEMALLSNFDYLL